MNCRDVMGLLDAYADGEVDPLRGYLVKRHLSGCPECASKLASILALRAELHADVPYYGAPPALHARARELLTARPAATAERARRQPAPWSWLALGAASGCAATVLAWVVGTALIEASRSDDLVAAAISRHTQATLSHETIQVASSDQHTVKPWLSARLDYSPPVPDRAAQGFTLVGGRLDQLDGRPVATLVYRYREHTIDVFVRPEPIQAPVLVTKRGFNVAHRTGSAMDWLAVSDVSPDVLSAFTERLALGSAASDLRN